MSIPDIAWFVWILVTMFIFFSYQENKNKLRGYSLKLLFAMHHQL